MLLLTRGAWIKTLGNANSKAQEIVAPHRGAWIETKIVSVKMSIQMQHPALRNEDYNLFIKNDFTG